MTKLLDQLFMFPNAALVDVIDALSMQLEVMFKPDLPKKAEVEIPYMNDKESPWYKDGKKKFSYKDFYGYK